MFQVHWNYRGNHDRILVLMPPLIQSLHTIEKHPYLLQKIRTTLHQLCFKDTIQYVVMHIPFLDTKHFSTIEQLEIIYGIEIRFLDSLSLLIDRKYTPYLTNECVYLLKNTDEWTESITPWEWYFNVCIVEQLYKYYDASSKLIQDDFKYDGEVTVGANFVYESVCASLNMTKKISFDGNILRNLAGIHSDFNEGDVVLIVGKIGSFESKELYKLLTNYIQECRLTSLYLFGHPKDSYKALFEEYPEVGYHSYMNTCIDKRMMEWLWEKFKKHGPKYNTFVFLGAFEIEESNIPTWEALEKPYLKACMYTPESWSSLHPALIIKDKHPYMVTIEPFGLLHYFLEGSFQIKEGDESEDKNDDDDDNTSIHEECNCEK